MSLNNRWINFRISLTTNRTGFSTKKTRREGSVRVEKVPQKPDPSKNDDDYVDFEEIK